MKMSILRCQGMHACIFLPTMIKKKETNKKQVVFMKHNA